MNRKFCNDEYCRIDFNERFAKPQEPKHDPRLLTCNLDGEKFVENVIKNFISSNIQSKAMSTMEKYEQLKKMEETMPGILNSIAPSEGLKIFKYLEKSLEEEEKNKNKVEEMTVEKTLKKEDPLEFISNKDNKRIIDNIIIDYKIPNYISTNYGNDIMEYLTKEYTNINKNHAKFNSDIENIKQAIEFYKYVLDQTKKENFDLLDIKYEIILLCDILNNLKSN